MATESKDQKKPSSKLIIVLALIAIVIVVVLVTQNKPKPAPVVEAEPPKPPAETAETQGANRPVTQEAPPPTEETAPEPESNAERAYLVEDFRDTARDWSKFKLAGTKITPEGIVLEDAQTEGSFESPCTALKLPSNMVALLWKETLPDGTVVKPEMQLSYDCQNWSAWYPIESTGDDINPLYPNGDPNPNYGYVPGSYVSLGLDLCPFIRYRFNLARGDLSKQSPTVPGARFYHLDSTLGEGKTITDVKTFPPGPMTTEELAKYKAETDAANATNPQGVPEDATNVPTPTQPETTP